jgi:hypothetical protein
MLKNHSSLFGALVVVFTLAFASPALAGPPLICQPFETGSTRLIAWGTGSGWNEPLSSYDLSRLTADTLRALDADHAVLARMENLRRATIYAMKDPAVAQQLLGALMARALTPNPTAQTWFDAGYLIEAYKQGVHLRGPGGRFDRQAWSATDETLRVDGYGFVKKAIQMAGPSAEMELAASLMTQGTVASAHRSRALASAGRGSVIAQHIAKQGY